MGSLFGTDGVRGIANRGLDCPLAYNIGRAVAAIIAEGKDKKPLFLIGGDTRTSTEMLSAAVSAGICSSGADVIRLGVIPTPAVSYLVGKYRADAGIVISASHNPFEYNGIKIFGADGKKLPDMLEDRIEATVSGGAGELPSPVGEAVGNIRLSDKSSDDYIKHIIDSSEYSFEGIKVAVDCANGASSATAGEIFTKLGATVSLINASPDGKNINTDCGSTHIEALGAYVRENRLDCGAAFDGDADRCIFVDENGEEVDGDAIMAICALDLAERGRLRGNRVVGTVMTNLGFVKFCDSHGINFTATKVGDRFVLEEMLLADCSFGGEPSGHIIFRDHAVTGDGQLTAVQLLSLIKRSGKPLSELSSVMVPFPQVTVNVPVTPGGKLRFYTDERIGRAIEAGKESLGDDGRLIVRPSGTEPYIRVTAECKSREEAQSITARLAELINNTL